MRFSVGDRTHQVSGFDRRRIARSEPILVHLGYQLFVDRLVNAVGDDGIYSAMRTEGGSVCKIIRYFAAVHTAFAVEAIAFFGCFDKLSVIRAFGVKDF